MLNATQGFTYNKFEKPNDWPKIDKTFDYKIENGKLLSGNEHIYLSGPVTYTKVGSPTIVDNVVSGFSSSDYLTWSNTPSVSNPNTYEVGSKIHTGTGTFDRAVIIGNLNAYCFGFEIKENKIISVVHGGSMYLQATGPTVAGNTTYNLRAVYVASSHTLTLSVSTDNGTTWTDYTKTNNNFELDLSEFTEGRIGYRSSGSGYALNASVDLNQTYIKINDQLWFYGKNYTTKNMVPVPAGLEYNNTTTPSIGWANTNTDRVKGPVNYTVVGEPTIVNGVASGFSSNDYLNLPNISNFQSFEQHVKFTTASLPPLDNMLIIGTHSLYARWGLKINSNNKMWGDIRYQLNGSWTGMSTGSFDFTLEENTTYYGKLVFENNRLYCGISTDDANWTYSTGNTLPEGAVLAWPSTGTNNAGYLRIGGGTQYAAFNGSIDLNETYIKINGQAWFGNCPSEFQQFTPAPKGAMIGKDDTHSLAVETYQDKGTVDYTIVGTPTIADGVVSGFSSGNYLGASALLYDNTTTPFNVNIRFARGSGTTNSTAFGCRSVVSGTSYPRLRFYMSSSNKMSIALRDFTEDTTDGTAVTTTFSTALTEGVYYSANVNYNGIDTVTYTLYDNNGTELETITKTMKTKISSGQNIRIGDYYNAAYWNGSIDLNNTYIKVNGQYWFHPYPNSYPKLVGPVNYTVAGSPTIENGIVSDFSTSNGLVCNSSIASTGNIEFNAKINVQDFSSVNPIFKGAEQYQQLVVRTTGHIACSFGLYDGEWRVAVSEYAISANATYTVNVKLENNTFHIKIYDADNQLLADEQQSFTYQYKATSYMSIGIGGDSAYFKGSIDLNQTYIKVNGALWFGKEDWTPSTYTDNAIYLLGAHKADYSNYNELSLTSSIETESDEVGSYNIWIDNQKVIENKTDNTLIEWDKLALTTGYSITTPSALKAHPIKIEPTNNTDSIIAFNTETIEESDESI